MTNPAVQEDKEFEKFIRKACAKTATELRVYLVLVAVLVVAFIFIGLNMGISELAWGGVAAFIVGFMVFRHYYEEMKGGTYWLERIKNSPQDFLWIKPVVSQEAAAEARAARTEQNFQLLTENRSSITFKCGSPAAQTIFLRGAKFYLPDAHLGSSRLADDLYKSNPKGFIGGLIARSEYFPARSIGER